MLLLNDDQADGDGDNDRDRVAVAKCDLKCRGLWSLNFVVVGIAARELLVVMRNLRQSKSAGLIHNGRSQNRPLHRVI